MKPKSFEQAGARARAAIHAALESPRGARPVVLAAAVVGALALSAGPAVAEVIMITPTKDNTLFENGAGALSNGAGVEMFTGLTNEPLRRRALIAFDIASNVPPGSTINSVTLRLNMSRTIAMASAVSLHRLTRNWGEGTSNASGQEGMGAPSTANDATWVHSFFSSGLWTTAGGDFTGTASAALIVDGVGFYTWGSTSQMVADVQSWLDTPSNNFGWLLRGLETTPPTAKRFDTREHPIAGNRPLLTIDFTDPGTPTLGRSWGAIKSLYR